MLTCLPNKENILNKQSFPRAMHEKGDELPCLDKHELLKRKNEFGKGPMVFAKKTLHYHNLRTQILISP